MESQPGGGAPLLVGFAAETSDVVARARAKRERKHADLIVANKVGSEDRGFEAETNAVTIIDATSEQEVPLQRKAGIAAIVLDRVECQLGAGTAASRT